MLRFELARSLPFRSKPIACSRAFCTRNLTWITVVSLCSLLLASSATAQTCDSGARPCLNPVAPGSMLISGVLKLDSANHVPDGTSINISVNGMPIGAAEWNADGTFAKHLSVALLASAQVEVTQLPSSSGGTATLTLRSAPRRMALTPASQSQGASPLVQNYIALQQAKGRIPQITKVENGKKTRQNNPNCDVIPPAADPDSALNAAKQDGTYSPFGSVFDVLAAFTDAGNGAYPAAQSSIQTEVLGKVEWETAHYGYQNTQCTDKNTEQVTLGFNRTPDFSFGGSIGVYPELVLENLTSTTETIAQPSARPMFQDAFHWSLGPRANYPVASHGEIGAFANFGQNFLVNQVTSFKDGDNTVVATPVSNGVGRAAGFIEGGLQGRILGRAVWLAHDNKYDILRPLFLIAGGVRKDWRFSRNGDLGAYEHPRDRVFFQFFVNLTQIVGYTNDIQKQAPASIRFGIDMDRGMLDQKIPTATRYYVSADINIMNIFKPSTQQSAAPTNPTN